MHRAKQWVNWRVLAYPLPSAVVCLENCSCPPHSPSLRPRWERQAIEVVLFGNDKRCHRPVCTTVSSFDRCGCIAHTDDTIMPQTLYSPQCMRLWPRILYCPSGLSDGESST